MLGKKQVACGSAKSLSVLLCTAVTAATLSLPATAQESAPQSGAATRRVAPKAPDSKEPQVSRTKATSPNATINLVNLLVTQGVLTDDQAQNLIKQAEDEAYVSRQAAKDATLKADEAAKAATAASAAASPPGSRQVTYVPEIVKRQLRDEIKREVMARAEKENWASPGMYPEWASRIKFYGDVRARIEKIRLPKGNDTSGNLVNYNAINTGTPYDTSNANSNFWPIYNADQDRSRMRLRARLGLEAELGDGFSTGLRIASGESNSPVSANQTMGASGGNFSKYAVWLDRAFLKYDFQNVLTLNVGRFDNPFFSPTDLVWNRELGFDGAAVQAKHEVLPGITPFLVAGAFPIFNTDLNFGSTNLGFKYGNTNKWLYGAQAGVGVKLDNDITAKFGVAYYNFTNVQGQLSSPCSVISASDSCDTDALRPSFAQKGNTYFALRNIVPELNNGFGSNSQYQYFGMASEFRNVVLTGQVDLGHFHPVHITLDGEYVRNVAFDRNLVSARALSNVLPTGLTVCNKAPQDCTPGDYRYVGGNSGYIGRVTVGHRELKQLWDWNVNVGYKYLESDAVIDAFADSDFGLGGTNLKGYFVGGNLALSKNVWASLRWLSANSVAGSPYAVDIFQFDLNAKF